MAGRLRLAASGLAALLAGAAAEPPRPVRVAVVHYAPLRAMQELSGAVQPRTRADLAFQAGGRVVARPVEIGDHVRAGQVLAQLDLSDLALAEQADQAAVQAAEADAVQARAAFERYQRLGRGSAAFLPSEYDSRAAASRMADARLLQAARQLALAQNQRDYGTLRADADGVVTALAVQVGQVVAAGQTVATLAHTADVEVAVDVPETLLGAIRAAGDVTLGLWAAPGVALRGRVREIGALADAASRTFAVRITVVDPPPGLLALGMTASVGFGGGGPAVAALPATALCDRDGQPAVWVLDAARQRAALHPVRIAGYRGDGSVLLAAGLTEGDRVVTAGTDEIEPDMALTAWAGAAR